MDHQSQIAGCQSTKFCQTVPQTYEQRYNMYMQASKEQLASMLAQRDMHDIPEACAEWVCSLQNGSETYSASTVEFISDYASTGVTKNNNMPLYNYD